MAAPSFETTHAQLRELLGEMAPEQTAQQLLAEGHTPLHVLHGLHMEERGAEQRPTLQQLDELVRGKMEGPVSPTYEAYLVLQTAKDSAPLHIIDRDAYAVSIAEQRGLDAVGVAGALPYVVDLPDPSVDRRALAELLLSSAYAPPPEQQRALPMASLVVTGLAALPSEQDRATPPDRPLEEGQGRPEAGRGPVSALQPGAMQAERAELLARQLAALDADRHQVVIGGFDGAVRYVAPTADGRFELSDEPTWLDGRAVEAALPVMMKASEDGAQLKLVSESHRHHYVVLDGLDASQARELDDHFGANLVMRVGDEHTAVVRLTEEPERALKLAALLRARFPDLPEDGSGASRGGPIALVSARVDDVMQPLSAGADGPRPAFTDSPAATVERFVEHREGVRRDQPALDAEALDVAAARKMVRGGYATEQVAGAITFASPELAQRADRDAYALKVAQDAREKPIAIGRVPGGDRSPDVGEL